MEFNMLKILLVSEKQDSLSDLQNAILKKPGITVKHVKSGLEALDLLSGNSFDLVIADERPGDMGSIEFANKLVVNAILILYSNRRKSYYLAMANADH